MTARPFGSAASGAPVEAVDLVSGGLSARVITLGATLQDLRLAGAPWPLVLGSDDPAVYGAALLYAGAVVGPVANRIGGAQAEVGGKTCAILPNEGTNVVHSGAQGLHGRVWRIHRLTPQSVTLRIELADGEGGLPGNRRIGATYRLTPGGLVLMLSALTDAPTLINLAHHGYWTLDGTPDIGAHRLTVFADSYLPVDSALLPVGGAAPVAGSGFDLRGGPPLGDAPPLDHNFCLPPRSRLAPAARLAGQSGVTLDLLTTEPGLQVYDGRHFAVEAGDGLDGRAYGAHAGLALEAQHWPDAPNNPDFPPILLEPGQSYRQTTVFRIARTG